MTTSASQIRAPFPYALSRRLTLVGIVGFAAAVAAASQVAIPLPWTPVPITLQPMLVVLAGMWLGPVAGMTSMLLYLAAGAAGLPVFTPIGAPGFARFFGPTGGYLIAYPAAAFIAGMLAARSTTFGMRWLAALVGIAVIYVGGIAQLSLLSGGFVRAVQVGVAPFALLDLGKAFVAAAISGSRRRPSTK
ncbi:MAG TPA: biotin transporter BioY [Gemmatimonadaceae bacterium]